MIGGTRLAIAPCLLGAVSLLLTPALHSQKPVAAIDFHLPDLRKVSGNKRTREIGQLALTIRAMPANADCVKPVLASELADFATEGDPGRDTLQEVTTTLSEALRECPLESAGAHFLQLARLVRFEGMSVSADDPRMAARMAVATATLEAEDRDIQQADFTLADLHGKTWTLKDLRGKVVLVNFWAAGCPPCVHEIPALEALYRQFRDRGLVVLAVSDDDAATMRRFLAAHRVSYPVLLDAGRNVADRFHVVGIPRTVVFDRGGRLAAQAIDGRTLQQFVHLLGRAGLPGSR
jgi:peroxiredoxin